LSNSVTFTGAGGQVIVSTALTDEQEVVLRVRDTGSGISEKDLQTALKPFGQTDSAVHWAPGGTGLGLPITKALVEANHAFLRIASEVGDGTLVEVAFPGTRMLAQ
jgi:signal transduction histidine kinase